MPEQTDRTRSLVDALYAAYFRGDSNGMLAACSEDVEVVFLGRGLYRGMDEARRFLAYNTGALHDLDFRIRATLVDGASAAVVWDETARTPDGAPYENHGVDVYVARGDELVAMHENNDIVVHRHHFGRVTRAAVLADDRAPGPPPPEMAPGHEPAAGTLLPAGLAQVWAALDESPEALGRVLGDGALVWSASAAGRDEALTELAALAGTERRPTVVVGDGDILVAELVVAGARSEARLTQVVRLASGRVTALHTYLDPDDLLELGG